MKGNFNKALKIVLGFEGGVSDDKDDSGGYTKYGIAQNANKDVDVKSLTEDQAAMIYKERYWDASKCDELPDEIDIIVFDMAVNHGVARAGKTLQFSLGVMLDYIDLVARNHECFSPLAIDGVIGNKTLLFAQQWVRLNPLATGLLSREILLRRTRFYSLLALNQTQRKFYFGWVRQRVVNLACALKILHPTEKV